MRMRSAVPVGVCCLLMAVSAGAKRGPKVPGAGRDQQPPLPEGVKKTVDEHFPGGQILSYEREADEKRQLFFVDIKTDKGR